MHNEPQAERDRIFFDSLASSYVKKDIHSSSRKARIHRLEQTTSYFWNESNRPNLLEVGCGAGFSAEYLKGRYATYCGVDHSRKLIEFAEQQFGTTMNEVTFFNTDACELAGGKQFDGIFMIGVLHHMENPVKQLNVLRSYLKPNGYIAINEPNSANPIIQLLRFARMKIDSNYTVEQRTYSKMELQKELLASGFDNINIKAQGFFSTPFAEVRLYPGSFWLVFSKLAIWIDKLLESTAPNILSCVSWNIIAYARKTNS